MGGEEVDRERKRDGEVGGGAADGDTVKADAVLAPLCLLPLKSVCGYMFFLKMIARSAAHSLHSSCIY